MNVSEPISSAEGRLRAASPHALVAAVGHLPAERFGAREVTLLLADYGLTVLQPVTHLPHTGDPVSAHDGPAGTAFTTQKPVVEVTAEEDTQLVHLPVSVRGDRLGVLCVRHLRRPRHGAAVVCLDWIGRDAASTGQVRSSRSIYRAFHGGVDSPSAAERKAFMPRTSADRSSGAMAAIFPWSCLTSSLLPVTGASDGLPAGVSFMNDALSW